MHTEQRMNEFPADLVTFTEEILNGKLHFLRSDMKKHRSERSKIFHTHNVGNHCSRNII